MRFQTLSVHAGVDKDTSFNSVITPIYQTSTFRFEDIGTTKGYDYTRTANPTRTALEENIAALEGGLTAKAVATGMAASMTVLHFLKTGDHVLCTNDCYGGTERILRTFRDTFRLQSSYVNMADLDAVRNAIQPNTKALWIETPSNPLLNIIDIKALADIAHDIGALAIVDNTFLTPVNQRPFEFGADIIVHSTTKYLNGHSDVVGGAVIVNRPDLVDRVQAIVNALGVGESPFDSWLVLRGIKTLVPRMKMHEENAHTVAKFLLQHPRVKRVFYPGLSTHPGHTLAKRQQHGFGGMVSLEVKGTLEDANNIMRSTKIFTLAESLGGIESLICHPCTMTHASMNPEAREKVGINERIIRLSVGIEDKEDLIEDLEQALGN